MCGIAGQRVTHKPDGWQHMPTAKSLTHTQLKCAMQERLCAVSSSATFGRLEGTMIVVGCSVAEDDGCRGLRYGIRHRPPRPGCLSSPLLKVPCCMRLTGDICHRRAAGPVGL